MKHLGISLENFLGVLKIGGGNARFFEEIKAVHWPLAFLTYLLRNLRLVWVVQYLVKHLGMCVGNFLGVLKIGCGNARFFEKIKLFNSH